MKQTIFLCAFLIFSTTSAFALENPLDALKRQAQSVGVEKAAVCYKNKKSFDEKHFQAKWAEDKYMTDPYTNETVLIGKAGDYKHRFQKVKGLLAKFSYFTFKDDNGTVQTDSAFPQVELLVKLLGKGNRTYKIGFGCNDKGHCYIDCDGPQIDFYSGKSAVTLKAQGYGFSVQPNGDVGCGADPILEEIAKEMGIEKQADGTYSEQDRAVLVERLRELAEVHLSSNPGADDIFELKPVSPSQCHLKDVPAKISVPFTVEYPSDQETYDDLFEQPSE